MKLSLTQSTALPAGSYLAKVQAFKPTDGQFGPQLEGIFDIQAPPAYAGRQVKGWTSAKLSPATKLYRWLCALYDGAENVPVEWDSDDAVGRMAILDLVTETRPDGSTYNKISAVRPYRPKTGAQPAPVAPAPKPAAQPQASASLDDDARWSAILADEGAATASVEPW